MKILFVSMTPLQSNASANIRNVALIKGLKENGHVIDTLTLETNIKAINYDHSFVDVNSYINKSYSIPIHSFYERFMAKKGDDDFSVQLKKDFKSIIRNYIRHFAKKTLDVLAVYDNQKVNLLNLRKVDINLNEYDFVISSSDPKSSHLIVEKLIKKQKSNIDWIQYWGDPFLADITRKSKWNSAMIKYEEKRLLKKAVRIVYVSPLTLEEQKHLYKEQSHKMIYLNQVPISDFYQNHISKEPNKRKDEITFGYFGAYNSKIRNISPLYNVFLNNISNKLIIVGNSDLKLSETDNISVTDRLSYEKARDLESQTDILIVICNLYGSQIPGKVFYSVNSRKPIIVITDGPKENYLREYFKSFNRFTISSNNEKSIFETITRTLNDYNAFEIYKSAKFSAKYLASEFLKGL